MIGLFESGQTGRRYSINSKSSRALGSFSKYKDAFVFQRKQDLSQGQDSLPDSALPIT